MRKETEIRPSSRKSLVNRVVYTSKPKSMILSVTRDFHDDFSKYFHYAWYGQELQAGVVFFKEMIVAKQTLLVFPAHPNNNLE